MKEIEIKEIKHRKMMCISSIEDLKVGDIIAEFKVDSYDLTNQIKYLKVVIIGNNCVVVKIINPQIDKDINYDILKNKDFSYSDYKYRKVEKDEVRLSVL